MKALILKKHTCIEEHSLELLDIPKPVAGAGELLVRVKVCGVCRTDLHLVEGDLAKSPLPIVPGHQIVGVVESLGPGCQIFKPGDRVGVAWLRYTCGACAFCLSGRENLCNQSRYTGYHENGGYAEYVKVLEAFAYPLPDGLSDEDAAPLLCAGIIGYRALKRCHLPEKGRLGIFGFGSSAHIVIQIALHRQCEVFVATRAVEHQELARKMGATWAGSAENPLPVEVDSAIIFAPAGQLVPIALQSVVKGGTVVSADISMSPIPQMDYVTCVFHEKVLSSVEANTREDGRELLALAVAIPIKPHVHLFKLEEANRVLEKIKNHGISGSAVLVI